MKFIKDIESLTNASNHLEFIQKIVQENSPSEDLLNRVNNEITKIKNRLSDSNLYITVVGRASAGKSTIINAFLNDVLLKSSANIMTTAIATSIRYGEKLSLEVRFRNVDDIEKFGIERNEFLNAPHSDEILPSQLNIEKTYLWKVTTQDEPISFCGRSFSLRELIPRLTATNAVAKHIASISIIHPSSFLKSGVVIIDTPGADATNNEHIQITKAAVGKADASLIITPGNAAMSNWLREILIDQDFLLPMIYRCVFMISKMDIVNKSERKKSKEETIKQLIDNALKRLKKGLNEIGINILPRIYYSAAQAVIDDIGEEEPEILEEEERAYWKKEFLDFQEDFRNYMIYQRAETIAEKVLRLLEDVVDFIEIHFNNLWEDYSLRKKQLSNITKDMDDFCNDQDYIWQSRIKNAFKHSSNQIEIKLWKEKEKKMKSIENIFWSAQSVDEVNKVINDKIQTKLNISSKKAESIIKEQNKSLINLANSFNDSFDSKFIELYDKLKLLGTTKYNQDNKRIKDLRYSSNIGLNSKTLEDTSIKDTFNAALIGGVIGFVVPVIGPWVGAFLGGVFSNFFGKSIEEKKKELWEELESKVLDFYHDLEDDSFNLHKEFEKKLTKQIQKRIKTHAVKYRGDVKKMREKQIQERQQLEKLQVKLASDIKEIKIRRQQIQKQKKSLNEHFLLQKK